MLHLVSVLALALGIATGDSAELRRAPLMTALRSGGYTVILRHARTDRSFQEERSYVPKDRSAQRNLTDEGVRDAALMGVVFRKYHVSFAEIISSPMFRSVETAEMAAGRPETTMVLRTFPSTPEQAALIARPPKPGTNRLLVTHHFVIETHVPGISPGEIGESEAVVVRHTAAGKVEIVGRITLDDWRALANPDQAAVSSNRAHANGPRTWRVRRLADSWSECESSGYPCWPYRPRLHRCVQQRGPRQDAGLHRVIDARRPGPSHRTTPRVLRETFRAARTVVSGHGPRIHGHRGDPRDAVEAGQASPNCENVGSATNARDVGHVHLHAGRTPLRAPSTDARPDVDAGWPSPWATLTVVCVCLTLGGISALEARHISVTHGFPLDWFTVVASTTPRWILLAVVLPFVLLLATRFPLVPVRGPIVAMHIAIFAVGIGGARRAGCLGGGPGVARRHPLFGMIPRLTRSWYNTMPTMVSMYAGVLIAAWGMAEARERQRRTLRASQLETQLQSARLAALRAQLQPHFLYNTLNGIAALVSDVQPARAVAAIEQLGELLHASLREDGREEITVDEEVALAERYLALQGMRFGDRLSHELHVAPEVARLPRAGAAVAAHRRERGRARTGCRTGLPPRPHRCRGDSRSGVELTVQNDGNDTASRMAAAATASGSPRRARG